MILRTWGHNKRQLQFHFNTLPYCIMTKARGEKATCLSTYDLWQKSHRQSVLHFTNSQKIITKKMSFVHGHDILDQQFLNGYKRVSFFHSGNDSHCYFSIHILLGIPIQRSHTQLHNKMPSIRDYSWLTWQYLYCSKLVS